MTLRSLSDAFSDMPLTLKGITSFFAVYGVGSVLLALAPGVEHTVAGRSFDQAAFFDSGHGVFALLMGGWLAAAAFGLLQRAGWARWATIAAWALFVPAEQALAESPRVAVQSGLACAWALGVGAYLFQTRGAVGFFSRAAAS